jgi:hypothetical protein
MNVIKKLFKVAICISVITASFSPFSCARTATTPVVNKVMQFAFRVKGNLVLNREDITYYLILYAPRQSTPLDTNLGPRINSPDITKSQQFLEGRLPFIYQLPGDQPSKWTDFFYITYENGKTVVGRGRLRGNNPEIYDRNYINPNTKPLNGPSGNVNGYQIEFLVCELNNGDCEQGTTQDQDLKTITGNLASSDGINNGFGFIYDSWLNNSPFAISVNNESPQSQQDFNTNLVLRKIPNRPDPVVPNGVNPDDLNITEFTARITK